MAETVVSSLIDRLVPLLTQEAKLLRGIHGEVADIKDELESIQSFLKDADARAAAEEESSEGVKTWVKQVREVAFRIDVAVDRYLLDVAQHDPHRRGFIGFVHKTAHLLKTLKPRHKMASEIQEIKASFQKIKERSDRYQFKFVDQGTGSIAPTARWSDPRNDSLYLDDIDIVGIEFPRYKLIGWLVRGPPHRIVLSVVGMGGLGKTTLAKKVYDHQIVRGHFDCHAWISVSQSYNIEDLLRSMIKQFCEVNKETPPMGVDTMDGVLLINNLRDYLQQKRYVVVFDDVWKIDFWEDIKHALLDNSKGCRIMITTRKLEVVNFCKKSSHVCDHQLQPLPPEKAWELFCKRAFRFDFGGQCPTELEKLSHEIVKKCQGLPLAITAIGGLLSTKNKTLFEWRNLHDNLGFELGRNPHLAGVNKVLSLSFEELPYHLKSCLLYFGMYPGFVNKINDKAFEDIGQEYLIELINRSLVQVLNMGYGGVVTRCRIHDLLHEIILQKMEDLSFCHVLSKEESSFEGLTRRVSQFKKSHIHSLLFFNINEFPISFMSKFLQNFKLVKVLDFENTPLDHLPEEVGNLFNLRYLNLSNTKVKILPNSIGKLQNLEILLMWQTAIQEIPVTINMLHKLRCLAVRYLDVKMDINLNILRGIKLHWSVGCLKALTELQYVDANYGGVKLIEELGKLSKLETGRALCVSIENLNYLKYLFLSSINEDEVIDLQPISSPPKGLQDLRISGRLAKLPDWISELQHLVFLEIFWTGLSEDPLKAFQNLPNLAKLILGVKAYNGEQLQIGKGGFSKLKELWLRDLSELNSLNMEKEAFPLLEKLHIADCSQLKEVPSGFQHLRNLKELIITDMPTEFEKSLDPEQGSHYWIIEHVPFISLRHKVRKGLNGYESRNLRSKDLERSRDQTINQDDDNKNNISGDDISASVEKG
ncbi:hypothetical protein ACB092_06G013100 [Castanea dentata]